jgi:hypothetical protein
MQHNSWRIPEARPMTRSGIGRCAGMQPISIGASEPDTVNSLTKSSDTT